MGRCGAIRLDQAKWAVLITVSFGIFMALLDATIVNMAVPAIMTGFDAGISQVSWVLNGYAMVFVVLMITMGRLADQFGRKLLYMIGLLIFTIGSALCGVAQSINQLIGFRLVQAVGASIISPVSLALVSEAFPASERGKAVGAWAAVGAVASAAGPTLGGFLTEYFSWQWVFLVNIPIGIGSIVASWVLLQESKLSTPETAIDWPGVGTLSTGLLALVWALIKGQDYGWTSGVILGLFLAAAFLLALFVWWEERAPVPMLRLALFRDRTFAAANVVNLVAGFSVMGALFLLPIFLVRLAGYTELRAAVAITPVPLLVLFTAPFIGWATDRIGAWPLVMAGFPFMAVGLWLYAKMGAGVSFAQTIPPSLAAGLGMGLTLIPATAAASARLARDDLGVGSGVFSVARLFGAVLGISVLVAVLTAAMDSNLAEARNDIREEVEQERLIPQAAKDEVYKQLDVLASSSIDARQEAEVPEEEKLLPYMVAAFAMEAQAQVGARIEAEVARLPSTLTPVERDAAVTAIKQRVREEARVELDKKGRTAARRLHQILTAGVVRVKKDIAAAFSLAYLVAFGGVLAGGIALMAILI